MRGLWYHWRMYIESIKMRLEENTVGAEELGGGEAVRAREGDEGRGYPPMSNVRDSMGARGLFTGHPPFSSTIPSQENILSSSPSKENNSSSPDQDLIIGSKRLATPIIPLKKNPEKKSEETIFQMLSPRIPLLPRTDVPTLPDPKKFFAPKEFSDEYALRVAEAMVAYFGRPLSGWYKEIVMNRDGSQTEVEKPYTAPLPLLAEFANMMALTESEIKRLAQAYPKTMGRAYEFAKDVVKTNVVRGGLNATYHPQFATFTLTNETNMKSKTESTVRTINMNDLLDDIENSDVPMYE